jgi:hypothetical protein
VKAARSELAAAFLDDQLRDAKKKLDVAARASGTTLAGLFGVGPVAAAAVIGDVGDVSRLHGRDLFAATFPGRRWLGGQPRILGRKAPPISEGSSGWRHSACSPWMWSRSTSPPLCPRGPGRATGRDAALRRC